MIQEDTQCLDSLIKETLLVEEKQKVPMLWKKGEGVGCRMKERISTRAG